MNAAFCSCLAPQIENLINLRRLSGTDYRSQAQLLGCFDRFLVEQNVQPPRLNREICEQYLQSLSALAPRSRANRFCVVRQLCQQLARTDPCSYIAEPLRSPTSRQTHRPYVFTGQEVQALLVAAAQLPPAGSLRPHTYHTLFGLLDSTGIRIGEACALNLEDFLPSEYRLYIAEGKFHKARWIALSESTCDVLQQYVQRRLEKEPRSPDAPLLLNERCQRLCHPTVWRAFMQVLEQCGIAYHARTGPRIHDLRHTFAVHRLLAWYRDGEDVNARLPFLATYLGHVNINSTQVYLQPTAELLGEVDRRFHGHYLQHLTGKGGAA